MISDHRIVFRIYKPTKTVTQSGSANAYSWHIRIEPDYYVKPFIGQRPKNPMRHIVLRFDSLKSALLYTKKCNVRYIIEMPKSVKRYPKSYASNFTSR